MCLRHVCVYLRKAASNSTFIYHVWKSAVYVTMHLTSASIIRRSSSNATALPAAFNDLLADGAPKSTTLGSSLFGVCTGSAVVLNTTTAYKSSHQVWSVFPSQKMHRLLQAFRVGFLLWGDKGGWKCVLSIQPHLWEGCLDLVDHTCEVGHPRLNPGITKGPVKKGIWCDFNLRPLCS